MPLEKITASDMKPYLHSELGDVPNKSAAEMKAFFDGMSEKVIIPKLNGMIDEGFLYRGKVPAVNEAVKFSNCESDGFYDFTTSMVSGISDKPQGLSTAGICCVYSAETLGIKVCVVYSNTGKMWLRTSNTTTWTAMTLMNVSENELVAYRGSMAELEYTAFSECIKSGFYECPTSYISSVTDKPSDLTSACVCQVFDASKTFGKYWVVYDILGKVWFKTSNITSWISLTPKDAYSYIYRGNVGTLGYTAFSQCTKNGFYSCPPSRLSLLTDKPEGLSKLSICSVRNADNLGLTIQNITDADGNTWQRSIAYPNTTAEWRLINNVTVPVDITGPKWCALGDSITRGYYSEIDELGNVVENVYDDSTSWAKICADICGFNLINKAVGGTGYVAKTVSTNLNALELVNTLDFKEYDFVTLAYGINDWKYNKTIESTLVNMRNTLDVIISSNPLCKIFVITPINCSYYGDHNSKYSLNSVNSIGETLEDMFEGIKSVCDEYGIELVDMTHCSIFNLKNLETLLPDGVHPTKEAHKVMARELAAKINYK